MTRFGSSNKSRFGDTNFVSQFDPKNAACKSLLYTIKVS